MLQRSRSLQAYHSEALPPFVLSSAYATTFQKSTGLSFRGLASFRFLISVCYNVPEVYRPIIQRPCLLSFPPLPSSSSPLFLLSPLPPLPSSPLFLLTLQVYN